ncbi:hypothetical protein C8R42DRAFT_648245 [Lentinula raphanica]|nr:hypothetical protein C8R42DRAFT_648245 [Lentinula raphanica]
MTTTSAWLKAFVPRSNDLGRSCQRTEQDQHSGETLRDGGVLVKINDSMDRTGHDDSHGEDGFATRSRLSTASLNKGTFRPWEGLGIQQESTNVIKSFETFQGCRPVEIRWSCTRVTEIRVYEYERFQKRSKNETGQAGWLVQEDHLSGSLCLEEEEETERRHSRRWIGKEEARKSLEEVRIDDALQTKRNIDRAFVEEEGNDANTVSSGSRAYYVRRPNVQHPECSMWNEPQINVESVGKLRETGIVGEDW